MKKIVLVLVLIAVIVAMSFSVSALFSQSSSDEVNEEVGVYYSESNEVLTISPSLQFSVEMEGLSTSGTYKVVSCCSEDYYLILLTEEKETITTLYAKTKITMVYKSELYYFYRN